MGRKLVTLDQDELDSVAPGRSRSLEIGSFVDREDIDPLLFNKTYWVASAKGGRGRSGAPAEKAAAKKATAKKSPAKKSSRRRAA